MKTEGDGEWCQSIHFNKLSCRQVFFFGPKGTPSREEHKTSGSVITIFTGALTNWCIFSSLLNFGRTLRQKYQFVRFKKRIL
jgi:hypothetical protein